jgi:hypothetical protein
MHCPSNWPWFLQSAWKEDNVAEIALYRGMALCSLSIRHILILSFVVRTRPCDRPLRLLKNFLEQSQWWELQRLNDSSEEILCARAYGFPQASAIHKVSFSEIGMRAHQINTAADAKQSTHLICWLIRPWWISLLNRKLYDQLNSNNFSHYIKSSECSLWFNKVKK